MKKNITSKIKRMICAALAVTLVLALANPGEVFAAKAKKKAAAKKVVVVLDPGHDTVHHGCSYNGFEEGYANLAIAMYCKQELERYNGVTVYLTRTTLDCPYGADPASSTGCLAGRVNFAKSVGANVIVSLHNDYDPDMDPAQCGSKIIIPNAFYRPDICLAGFSLAQNILPALTSTGLTVNNWKTDPNGTGICTRSSSISTYPDGTPKDYYALINKSKSAGIPAVIVEHAFCTSPSDLQNHLSTPEQLARLGVADATGIARYFGLSLR